MDKKRIYIKNPNYVGEQVEDDLVFILDNKAIVLHENEKSIYELFDGKKTILEISNELSKTYNNYLENDFLEYVNSLNSCGIIIIKEE